MCSDETFAYETEDIYIQIYPTGEVLEQVCIKLHLDSNDRFWKMLILQMLVIVVVIDKF